MSMRNYAVCGNGFVIKKEDIDLFKSFYVGKDKDFLECTDFIELANYIDIDYDYIQENGFFIGLGNAKDRYIDNETIGIYYFKKDNLFKKYRSYNEIIKEVIKHFKKFDIVLPYSFVEQRIGTFTGVRFS